MQNIKWKIKAKLFGKTPWGCKLRNYCYVSVQRRLPWRLQPVHSRMVMEVLIVKTTEKRIIDPFEDNWVMGQLRKLRKIDERLRREKKRRNVKEKVENRNGRTMKAKKQVKIFFLCMYSGTHVYMFVEASCKHQDGSSGVACLELTNRLFWLTSKSQRFPCLYLHCTVITSGYHAQYVFKICFVCMCVLLACMTMSHAHVVLLASDLLGLELHVVVSHYVLRSEQGSFGRASSAFNHRHFFN